MNVRITFIGGVYHRVQVSFSVSIPLHFGDVANATVTWCQWLFCNQFLSGTAHTYQDSPVNRSTTTVNGHAYLHTYPGSNPNEGPNRAAFAHATPRRLPPHR